MADTLEDIEEEIENHRRYRRKEKSVPPTGIESKPYWPEVKEMILEGVPVTEVVKYLIEKVIDIDYTEKALTRILYVKAKKLRMKEEILRQKQEIDYNFNVYGKDYVEPEIALQSLGFIAFDRVLIDFQKEKNQGTTRKSNLQNIRLAKDIWESIARIKIEAKKAQLPSINLNTQNNIFSNMDKVKEKFIERYGERVASVMVEPESRRKILEALECVRAIGQGPVSEKIHQSKEGELE